MVKNKIAIHFSIDLHKDYIPENGFSAKLFSSLAVEINSQRVSSNRSKGEYFLHDWLMKKGKKISSKLFVTYEFYSGNYDPQLIESLYITEGVFDIYSFSEETDANKQKLTVHRRQAATLVGDDYVYDFIMIASDPFLNQNYLLPPGVELQLSFERLKVEFSSLRVTKDSEALKNKILPLKNVFAEVEYISSPSLRNQMASIETQPLKYFYDDMDVIYKTIPV